jgi:hypothetical protein
VTISPVKQPKQSLRLSVAKITPIEEFTPAAWAKDKAKVFAQALNTSRV